MRPRGCIWNASLDAFGMHHRTQIESGWGKSKSAKGNIVGMKARKGQAGETKGTSEYVKGKKVKTAGRFAQFGSEAGGIAQHGKEWKGGLTKSGGRKYATDPDYEKKIAAITKGYGSITASFDVMSFKDLVNQIQERELTPTELKRREEIAKDLSDTDFKQRYGDRWKQVKMGTATKMAKNES